MYRIKLLYQISMKGVYADKGFPGKHHVRWGRNNIRMYGVFLNDPYASSTSSCCMEGRRYYTQPNHHYINELGAARI